jgi:hypothetical protein
MDLNMDLNPYLNLSERFLIGWRQLYVPVSGRANVITLVNIYQTVQMLLRQCNTTASLLQAHTIEQWGAGCGESVQWHVYFWNCHSSRRGHRSYKAGGEPTHLQSLGTLRNLLAFLVQPLEFDRGGYTQYS